MNTVAVVPSPEVKGDITTCRIETSQISVEREGVLDLVLERKYVSYDVCTKDIIEEYVVPEFTGFAVFCFCLLFIGFLGFCAAISD